MTAASNNLVERSPRPNTGHGHEPAHDRSGATYAIGAYALWGLVPIYWHWLSSVPAIEIIAHRLLWSFLFYALLITAQGHGLEWLRVLKRPETCRPAVLATAMLTVNWLIYIWAVNSGHVIDASLGYFITPLINAFIGRVILKEPLSRLKQAAIASATTGVLILIAMSEGIPWIALGLAGTFSTYGFLRKRLSVPVLHASTAETAVLVPLAAAALIYFRLLAPEPIAVSWREHALLAFSGVLTGAPLLWFAQAARRLPLATLGFFQYISPTLQFALGLIFFHEPFSPAKLTAFAFIWLGLGLYTFASIRRSV